jgi:hypothetical protein
VSSCSGRNSRAHADTRAGTIPARSVFPPPGRPSLSSVSQSPLVDAEFAPDMSELLWIGQSLVGEHSAQHCEARCGEKEPRQSAGGVEADEVAREQALRRRWQLRLVPALAGAPGPKLNAVGDGREGAEDLVKLASDVGALGGREFARLGLSFSWVARLARPVVVSQ